MIIIIIIISSARLKVAIDRAEEDRSLLAGVTVRSGSKLREEQA
jgi:hypothetical protein